MKFMYDCSFFKLRQGYVFWVDFTNDNINRATGIETPGATITNLVTTGITCAGK